MSKDYIKREDAILAMKHAWAKGLEPTQYIEQIPAADVAPVVHGRWERIRSNWYCTRCKTGYRITCGTASAKTFTFCPNCSAKMDKEETNELD